MTFCVGVFVLVVGDAGSIRFGLLRSSVVVAA
jgi:hypothetical protein